MEFGSILEVVLTVLGIMATIATTVGFAVRWFAGFLTRLENERRQAITDVSERSREAEEQCRKDNASLVRRLDSERDQRDEERREDMRQVLAVLASNAQSMQASAQALGSNAEAFKTLTAQFSRRSGTSSGLHHVNDG